MATKRASLSDAEDRMGGGSVPNAVVKSDDEAPDKSEQAKSVESATDEVTLETIDGQSFVVPVGVDGKNPVTPQNPHPNAVWER